MKRFYINANELKDPDGSNASRIRELAKQKGAIITDNYDDAEAVIVLGGDGTILKVAEDIAGRDIPMLGINLGTLGYLTEADMDGASSAIDKLISEDIIVEERMMLYGCVNGSDQYEDHALNDVVISGSEPLAIVKYDISVNGEFLNSYSADGLIIATPTGSTGYNMSAGGPIVEPKARLMVITPICPHTLNSRSIVLSAEDEIEVRIAGEQRTRVVVQFDGRTPHTIDSTMSARIRQSHQTTKIIRLNKDSFLKTLHNKLK